MEVNLFFFQTSDRITYNTYTMHAYLQYTYYIHTYITLLFRFESKDIRNNIVFEKRF